MFVQLIGSLCSKPGHECALLIPEGTTPELDGWTARSTEQDEVQHFIQLGKALNQYFVWFSVTVIHSHIQSQPQSGSWDRCCTASRTGTSPQRASCRSAAPRCGSAAVLSLFINQRFGAQEHTSPRVSYPPHRSFSAYSSSWQKDLKPTT